MSVRSLFVHFSSREDLQRALVARVRDRLVGMLRPIDPAAPLAARISELCRQRARIAEKIGPFRRAAAARASSSPTLASARAEGQVASRDQVERIFATELGPLHQTEQAHRVAIVDAVVSGETWDLLRTVHGLTVAGATQAMAPGCGLRPGGCPRSQRSSAIGSSPRR